MRKSATFDASHGGSGGVCSWGALVALFFFGWMCFAADRLLLNPMQPLISSTFDVGNAEFGLVMTVFLAVYGLMQIPVGIAADVFGCRRILIVGIVLSGVFTALYSTAESFAVLLALRFCAGFSESCYYGPQYALASRFIPTHRRTLGFSIICCGQPIGIALGLTGASLLAYNLDLGWRIPCAIYGAVTLIAAIAVIRVVLKDNAPREHRAVNSQNAQMPYLKRLGLLFKNRTYVALLILGFIDMMVFLMMTTWVPVFLRETKLLNESVLSWLASSIAWAAIPAALGWAWVADRFRCRKQLLVILFPIAAGSLCFLKVADGVWATTLALVLYGMTGKLGIDAILTSLIADAAPDNLRSSAFGFYNAISMTGATFSPVIHGMLRDATGCWDASFTLSVSLLLIGAFALLAIFLKEKVESEASRASHEAKVQNAVEACSRTEGH